VVLLFGVGYGNLIHIANHPTNLPQVTDQNHYASFANNQKDALLWVEFGKNGKLISELPQFLNNTLLRISTHGFQIGYMWDLHHGGTRSLAHVY